MSRYPIIQSPLLDKAEHFMRSTGPIRKGFLGDDSRHLVTILNEDQEKLRALGISDDEVADRLERLTEIGKSAMGDPIEAEGKYRITVSETRGKVACPWGHPGGLFPKNHIELVRLDTGEEMHWTDLSIHLIREHSFYQGIGSFYRLDPEKLKRVLEL